MQTTGQTDFSFLATPLAALDNGGLVSVADATVSAYNFLLDYGPQAPLEGLTAEAMYHRLEDIYAEAVTRIASAPRVQDASPLVSVLYRLIYHAGDFDMCIPARVEAFHAFTVRVVEADAAAPSLPECDALIHRLHLYVRMTEAEKAKLEAGLRAALARWAEAPAALSEQMRRLNVYGCAKVLFPLPDYADWAAAALERVARCALAGQSTEALFLLCDLLPVLRQRDVCPLLETDSLPAALAAELTHRLGEADDLAVRCRLLQLDLARREESLMAADRLRDTAPAAAADPLASEALSPRQPVYALQALARSYALRYSLHAVCPDEEGLRNSRWCLVRLTELHAALREKISATAELTEQLRLLAILADVDNVLAGHDPLLTHDACNFVFRTVFPLLERYAALPAPDAALEAAAMRLTLTLMADILPEDRAADELWRTLRTTARRWAAESWSALPTSVALVRAEVLHALSWQEPDAPSAAPAATREPTAAVARIAGHLLTAPDPIDADNLFQLYHTVSTLSTYPATAATLEAATLYPLMQQKARLAGSPGVLLLQRCMDADREVRAQLFCDETNRIE